MPIADLRTMAQSLVGIFGYLIFRVGAIQAGGMGLLGLILAMVGVYGVVSFGASLRTREIGIRVALGAQPRDVLRLILGQGLALVAVGILVGTRRLAGNEPRAVAVSAPRGCRRLDDVWRRRRRTRRARPVRVLHARAPGDQGAGDDGVEARVRIS